MKRLFLSDIHTNFAFQSNSSNNDYFSCRWLTKQSVVVFSNEKLRRKNPTVATWISDLMKNCLSLRSSSSPRKKAIHRTATSARIAVKKATLASKNVLYFCIKNKQQRRLKFAWKTNKMKILIKMIHPELREEKKIVKWKKKQGLCKKKSSWTDPAP